MHFVTLLLINIWQIHFYYIYLLPSSCYWYKRRWARVGSENQQDCIADIDFHIWNL